MKGNSGHAECTYEENQTFSPKELQQQAKFALMTKFLKPIVELLNTSFKPEVPQLTGFNKAYSYNIKNAITGEHPSRRIDYHMVLLGGGDLPNVDSPIATSVEPGI